MDRRIAVVLAIVVVAAAVSHAEAQSIQFGAVGFGGPSLGAGLSGGMGVGRIPSVLGGPGPAGRDAVRVPDVRVPGAGRPVSGHILDGKDATEDLIPSGRPRESLAQPNRDR